MRWRVISYAKGDPAWNMAVDEAILQAVIAGESSPTLRFYGWSCPSVTIGRLQKISSVPNGWDGVIVRRPTGGRAVLHGRDLTFSVVVGADMLGSPVAESYRRVGESVATALRGFGINASFFRNRTAPESVRMIGNCFDLSLEYELAVDGSKVLGSAQVRRSGVVLQQNSLVMAGEAQWPSWNEVEGAITASFQEMFGGRIILGNLSQLELKLAEELTDNKYATKSWTDGRR